MPVLGTQVIKSIQRGQTSISSSGVGPQQVLRLL